MPRPTPLISGGYYHIYNRGNNREAIFIEERNYDHFLKLYQKYITPIADTYAYCLLCNHFHFSIRIKDRQDLPGLGDLAGLSPKPHLAFSRLFNAYSKSFNKTYERTGYLFEKPFKRTLITSQSHFLRLLTYIHQNPQTHGFVDDFRTWPFTSYHALTSSKSTFLNRQDVHKWFEGSQDFIQFNSILISALDIEDFD